MYYFKSIIFCLLFLPLTTYSQDSSKAKTPDQVYRNTVLIGFTYGRQMPVGILAERYSGSNSLGVTLGYKFGKNWLVQGGLNTVFSGQVKENGVLDSMIGNGGLLVDNNGTYAEVRMYQRGYNWHVDFGKIFPIGNFDRNSGILFTAGIGFMEHKIKFTFQKTVLPQLEDGYYKGYDRLTNGIMARGFLGYQRIDPKGRLNFVAGFEMLNGFTKNRRAYNYDTRQSETARRNDLMLGFKIGIMVSLNGRQAGNSKAEEERYFE